jgi:predicted aspartyl protease
MDELFWGREYEDVGDWAERLTMAAEVWDFTTDKMFKIAKLNLRGRAKEWFRKLQPAPADWAELRTLIVQKYGGINADDIRMKMDAVRQEPKERVQKYFERLDKLFRKGQIPDVEQHRRFLARLRPEIRKLCVVRAFADIEELVAAAIEVERVLGELGETPLEPFKEERDEVTEETIVEKQVTTLNETLINLFKAVVSNQEASSSSTVIAGCQVCKGGDHLATTCPRLNDARPKCAKCGMPHRTENCEVKCNNCTGLGHSEDRCWKKPKNEKPPSGAANYLEVLISDDAATLQQLNKLCGSEDIFSHTRVPRRKVPMEVATGGDVPTPQIVGDGLGVDRDVAVRSKILSHFIKGKVALSPMETILLIPGELEHLESLVKLARRRRDSEMNENQVAMVSTEPTLRRICINKSHRSKTLHLLVEVNNYIVEGLVDTGASMTVMAVAVVRELGMMHLVTGSETYKTASGVITQAFGRINEVPMKVGGVQCTMTFMVVDTDSYDVLLGLDFFMKIGAIVDVERGLIQVRHGPGADVEVLPLTMVNLLQRVESADMVPESASVWRSSSMGDNSDQVMDQERTIASREDPAISSDSDTSTEDSEHGEVFAELVKQFEAEDEFGEDELAKLIEAKGPPEILRLILQEQADDFMDEEITEGDDYAD